jgi:hypothetical protein
MAGLIMPCQNVRVSFFKGTQLQQANNRLLLQQVRMVPQIEAAQVLQVRFLWLTVPYCKVVWCCLFNLFFASRDDVASYGPARTDWYGVCNNAVN